MRGLTRAAAFFSSTLAASTRAFLASTPTATSRATLRRALIQPTPFQMPAPILSTMVSQDTPKASDTPAIHAASMNSVAPRKLRLVAEPVADELPDDAARGFAQRARTPVQRGQAAAREQHQREAADAHRRVDPRAPLLVIALAEHDETRDAQHDGE